MAINNVLSIITLNVNGRVYNGCLQEIHFRQKTQTESEGWEKDAHAKGNDKKTGSHTHIRQTD